MEDINSKERKKYIAVKVSELEHEILNRVSHSMHLNKSECIRLLLWQRYDDLCKNNYSNSLNLSDNVPENVSELVELEV
jgi:6-pyruvoyl-tetrahydropterin synthase